MTRLALALLLAATSADAESFAERWPAASGERAGPLAVESTSTVMPPVILVQDEDKPPAARHRRHRKSEPGHSVSENNVCTRHHMRKVVVRKSWRCRK